MSVLRPVECVIAEEELLGRTPREVAALLGSAEGPLARHLAVCPSCAVLARDMAALASLEPVRAPAEVVEAALAAAIGEQRRIRLAERRASRRMVLRAFAVTLFSLPLCLLSAALIWQLASSLLGGLLSSSLVALVGGFYAVGVLAALSALAFTLTLLVGAAARMPHPPSLEVV